MPGEKGRRLTFDGRCEIEETFGAGGPFGATVRKPGVPPTAGRVLSKPGERPEKAWAGYAKHEERRVAAPCPERASGAASCKRCGKGAATARAGRSGPSRAVGQRGPIRLRACAVGRAAPCLASSADLPESPGIAAVPLDDAVTGPSLLGLQRRCSINDRAGVACRWGARASLAKTPWGPAPASPDSSRCPCGARETSPDRPLDGRVEGGLDVPGPSFPAETREAPSCPACNCNQATSKSLDICQLVLTAC